MKRNECVEQNSWCWNGVPCMCILEVSCKARSILVTWNEYSLEARAVKQAFGAHHLVCYQGKVVFFVCSKTVPPYGWENCFKNSIPLIQIKKLRQICPNMLLNYFHGPAVYGCKLSMSPSLISEPAMGCCLCKISHNSPTPTTHVSFDGEEGVNATHISSTWSTDWTLKKWAICVWWPQPMSVLVNKPCQRSQLALIHVRSLSSKTRVFSGKSLVFL